MRKVIDDGGFGPGYTHFTHRLAHGVGLDGHEWLYMVGGNTAKLAAGTTGFRTARGALVGDRGQSLEVVLSVGLREYGRPSLALLLLLLRGVAKTLGSCTDRRQKARGHQE